MKFIILAVCLVAAVMSAPMEPARDKRGIYIGSSPRIEHHVVAHHPVAYASAPIAVHHPVAIAHAPIAVHHPVAHSYATVNVHRARVYHHAVPVVAHHPVLIH